MIGLKKQSRSKISEILLTMFVVSGIFFFAFQGLYYLNSDYRKIVMSDYIVVLGKIEDVKTYKSKGFDIVYDIKGELYDIHPSVTYDIFKKYKVGDTISLYVSKKNPEMAIIKY